MLRIIAGKFRSRLINTPTTTSTRPTKDRVREAIFSALGNAIEGSHVLDLFAGSGAFAFESLSRGATHVTCVDHHSEVFKVLKENKSLLKLTDAECNIVFGDYKKHLKNFGLSNTKFNVVFIDPPYGEQLEEMAFKLILELGLLTEDGIIVVESDHLPDLHDGSFIKSKSYDYGATKVTIYWRS
jgi:16S rRNA (guanine966-N2)-methyltransferase